MHPLLLIFVKDPEPGKVKTRLAAGVGAPLALEIYRRLLDYTLELAKAVEVEKAVFYGNRIPEQDLWQAAGFPRYLQSGADLGERMLRAFQWGFDAGYGPIILIGSDCAQLSVPILEHAFDALSRRETVIGPARDGGYYLLGMQHLLPEVFANKQWSQDSVFYDTMKDIRRAECSFTILPALSDVDTAEDLMGTFLEEMLPESSTFVPSKRPGSQNLT